MAESEKELNSLLMGVKEETTLPAPWEICMQVKKQ